MENKSNKGNNTKENSESKITVYLFLIVIVIILFLFFKSVFAGNNAESEQNEVFDEANIDTVEGTQYLDITAKGGYLPTLVNAKAGVKTILRIKTSSTFDCSSAFSIPKLNIRKNLPPTGTTEIALGVQSKGTKLLGTCSMGMYSFNLNFN